MPADASRSQPGKLQDIDITVDGVAAIGAAVLTETPGTPDVDQLQRAARQRMSAFKLPSRWVVVATLQDIPHTPTGKIDKAALRVLLLSKGETAPA